VREKTPRRFHVPFFHPIGEVSFARMEVRAVGNPSSLAAAVRAAVKQTAPNLPPVEIQTMNDLVSESLTSDRMITKLTGFFGALAVLLACIGIYGIITYAVAGRTGEIGIRWRWARSAATWCGWCCVSRCCWWRSDWPSACLQCWLRPS